MAKFFICGIDKIRNNMRKHNLKLLTKTDLITKEQFNYYFNETKMSIKEICKKLNIGICLYNELRIKYICERKGKTYFEKNKEQILNERKERRKQWNKLNKKELWRKNRIYYRHKYKNDANYRWKEYLRLSIRQRIKLGNGKKKLKTEELLGCTINEFREYIKKQFKNNMSWENYGLNGWHLDHIIPCSMFNLIDINQQKKCFHYTNYQPLWATTEIARKNGSNSIGNLNKRDKILERKKLIEVEIKNE